MVGAHIGSRSGCLRRLLAASPRHGGSRGARSSGSFLGLGDAARAPADPCRRHQARRDRARARRRPRCCCSTSRPPACRCRGRLGIAEVIRAVTPTARPSCWSSTTCALVMLCRRTSSCSTTGAALAEGDLPAGVAHDPRESICRSTSGTAGAPMLDVARSRAATAAVTAARPRLCVAGELFALIGANGAGKTTLLRGSRRAARPAGQRRASTATDRRGRRARAPRAGIAQVPEGRRMFARDHGATTTSSSGRAFAARRAADIVARPRARATSCSRCSKERAAQARRHALGRRAADARDRPRADEPAACCCSTSLAWGSRRGSCRDLRRHARRCKDTATRSCSCRAERADRARARRPRLRDRDRPHRPRRRRPSGARRRRGAPGLSRSMTA